MLSFLFWNVGKQTAAFPSIARLTVAHSIDVLFLAECPENLNDVLLALDQHGASGYRVADHGLSKVRGITRLPESDFFPHYTNRNRDLTIWNSASTTPDLSSIQVAVVHLPAKVGGNEDVDQGATSIEVSRQIAEYEDREGCYHTLVVGDFNMNPYDAGLTLVNGFHAAMTRRIAEKSREWRRQSYRRFYNPMWCFFGDRTPGPPGTYYWDSTVSHNHHWHILDQVIVRPSLIERLHNITILDTDGASALVNPEGIPTKKWLSDHLPILCELDV